jgi:hypothetical protein
MSMIVEDGSGIYEANSYAGLSYAHSYLHHRNRHSSWDAASSVIREAALIAATDYIDKRFGAMFLGSKKYLDLSVAASNYLQFASQPTNGNTITIGSVTYTYVSNNPNGNDIQIGSNVSTTIGLTLTALSTHPQVDAKAAGSTSIIVRNKLTGEQPDVLCSAISNHISWDYDKLVGGSDSLEQTLEWPRVDVFSRAGVPLMSVPEKLRQATVEYAVRALNETLMPDPAVGETGQDIRRQFEKVGPIETEVVYSNSVKQIFKKFPAADRLLSELIGANGGVHR